VFSDTAVHTDGGIFDMSNGREPGGAYVPNTKVGGIFKWHSSLKT